MAKLFGTDGVRGKAGEYPLDPPTVRRLGAALVRALRHENPAAPVRFLVGRDTRESGDWIEQELARGVSDQGGQLTSVGVVPTPAVAYLTPLKGFTAGLVISASHNPFEDNGIKVFSGAGEKFTEVLEAEVEAIIADTSWSVADAHQAPVTRVDYRAGLRGASGGDSAARREDEAPHRDRLRQRRDHHGGARRVPTARLRDGRHRQRTRRPQHQPAVRLHRARASPAGGRGRRVRPGYRVRRRRRPRDLRRCRRPRGGRRRGDADVRQGHEGRGPAARQHDRGDGDEQHRPGDRVARMRASTWCARPWATST